MAALGVYCRRGQALAYGTGAGSLLAGYALSARRACDRWMAAFQAALPCLRREKEKPRRASTPSGAFLEGEVRCGSASRHDQLGRRRSVSAGLFNVW